MLGGCVGWLFWVCVICVLCFFGCLLIANIVLLGY